MSRQITASVTVTRARLHGSNRVTYAPPAGSPAGTAPVLTVEQDYEPGTADASGNFLSLVAAFIAAMTNALAQAFGQAGALTPSRPFSITIRTASVTYPAGSRDPAQIQSDLMAKIVQAEQLNPAQGDHVLAPDGTVLV